MQDKKQVSQETNEVNYSEENQSEGNQPQGNKGIASKNPLRTSGPWILLFALALLVVALVPDLRHQVTTSFHLLSRLDVEEIKTYILSFGMWAPAISFLLMVFQSVIAPLPAFVLTFANAGLFGWLWGALLSWTSAMAGASLCFLISKKLGRSTVEKLTSKTALESVDAFFERYGQYAVLIARLLPFVSFDVVSYGAGLTGMSFWSFFWATGLGQLPATLVYSYVGGMLVGGTRLLVFGLMILFALSVGIMLLKRFYEDKSKKSE